MKTLVVLCLLWTIQWCYGRLVPFTPCGKLFNYFESETQEIFGAMTFKNDLSGKYHLKVTMSIPTKTDKNITIGRKTSDYAIRNGENIEYYVGFPFNHTFPLLTEVVFNGKVYCVGPEARDEGKGVTSLTAMNDLETTIVSALVEDRTPASITINIPREFRNDCGKPDAVQSLVVNGIPTRSGEYPWLVALIYYNDAKREYQFRCSGSLVSKRFVITAAHCVKIGSITIPTEYMTLLLGKHNIRTWATRSTLRDVESIHVHPDYVQPSDADISLLKMSEPVGFSVTIKPICLWSESSELPLIVGKTGKLAGWGRDENDHPYVEEARQVEMPVVGQEDCLRADERFLKLTSNRTFCAGDSKNSGPCTGDSGGGFVIKRGDSWVLRGVVSSALLDTNTRSCDTSKYTVFADVAKVMDWVITILGVKINLK